MNEFDMLAAAETARNGELPKNFWEDSSLDLSIGQD